MLDVAIASCTQIGARSRNEDDLRFGRRGAVAYAVLSDGAGGHRGGAIASDFVVRTIALSLQSAAGATPQSLTAVLLDTHAALCELQQRGAGADRMHATVVALWLDAAAACALWSHVGDSRLYLLRHGRARQLTRDDTLVQQMVDAGYLSADEARDHPQKNQLIGAMGMDGAIDPHTVDAPLPLRDGDAFLLCSDGWWASLDAAAIESTFADAGSADDWLARMQARVRDAGVAGQDNFSAVAVWIGDPAQATRIGGLWAQAD